MTPYKVYVSLAALTILFSSCLSQSKLLYLDGATKTKNQLTVHDPNIIYGHGYKELPKYGLRTRSNDLRQIEVHYLDKIIYSQKKVPIQENEMQFLELYGDELLVITIYDKKQPLNQTDRIDRLRCYVLQYKDAEFVYEINLNKRRIWVSESLLPKSASENLYAFRKIDLEGKFALLVDRAGNIDRVDLKKLKNTFR